MTLSDDRINPSIAHSTFFGSNEAELRACARAADAGFEVPTVTVDGTPVPVSGVETGLLTIDLPADNIFGLPAQQALSVAHGWVALDPGRGARAEK